MFYTGILEICRFKITMSSKIEYILQTLDIYK